MFPTDVKAIQSNSPTDRRTQDQLDQIQSLLHPHLYNILISAKHTVKPLIYIFISQQYPKCSSLSSHYSYLYILF